MLSSLFSKKDSQGHNFGEKVVYMPGVFDLFHIGHLMAIQNARKLGDMLIVGVQTDESVEGQKKKRPVISTEDRKKILFNIKGVDWVIDYDNTDQSNVLKVIKPNIFACNEAYGRGNDNQTITTLKQAKELGIEIKRIPYFEGISTTYIKETIKCDSTTKN